MNSRTSCSVASAMMEPTLKKGSTIVIDVTHYFQAKPARWDIIMFSAPELEDLHADLGQKRITAAPCGHIANAAVDILEKEKFLVRPHIFYVKRIIGLPGERIAFTSSSILVDGEPVKIPRDLARVYAKFPGHENFRFGAKDHEVPKDSVFVMSDNVTKGKDSREIGPVRMSNISARVMR